MSLDCRTPDSSLRLCPTILRLLVCAALICRTSQTVNADDPAQALENSLTKVIEQSEPAVVSIARVRNPPSDIIAFTGRPLGHVHQSDIPMSDPEHPDFQPNSFGSGVIVVGVRPTDRVVLTNYHVVQGGPVFPAEASDDGSMLYVRFADRHICQASIIAADPRCDLAVLHLNLEKSKIEPGELKTLDGMTAAPVRKGQLVIMLGNPYALAHDGSSSAGWGMVSNLARRPLPWTDDPATRATMYRLGNLIQIDGRINMGNSGGPLLNLKGELVGLTTSLAAIEGYEKSAGFAIPFDELTRRVVRSLVAGHEVEYGMLGITPTTITPSMFRAMNTGSKQASAVGVGFITPNSPAQRAEIAKDDVILSVGGTPVYSDTDLMRVVGSYAPESEVEIAGWRGGRERRLFTVKVTLGKWPVHDDEGIIETTPRFSAWRGISVDYPTGRRRYHHRMDDPHRRAVVVTKVAPDSVAQSAGIQPGVFVSHVNGIPVSTPSDFAEATRMLRGSVELKLLDGGKIKLGE